MPSGAKKRKAAKKKKVIDSTSSSTTHSHHGESDGGEPISAATQNQHNPPQQPFKGEAVEVEKREDKSVAMESTEKMQKEEDGDIEIDRGAKSKKSHDSSSSSSSSSSDDESNVVEKKVVVLEKAPVVESVQPIESLIEKSTDKVPELAMETSSIVDTVKPHDDTKLEEKRDLVMEVAPMAAELDKNSLLEQKAIVNESASKDNNTTSSLVVEPVLKENEVEKPKASSESKDNVSTSKGADRVNESETPEYSERQPLVASAPRPVETTSWKSCCGMLEFFSGSER